MPTRSFGRSAATSINGHSAATPKNDRFSLCSFTFADGRQCRSPRKAGHPYLCAFHARKEAQALAGDKSGGDIAYHLSGGHASDYDLSSALGRLFAAVAQGRVKPKTASTLAYLGQTIVQAMHLSQRKPIQAFGIDKWLDTVRHNHKQSSERTAPTPQAHPQPAAAQTPPRSALDPDFTPAPNYCRCRALARLLPRRSAALHPAIGGCLGSLDEVEISLNGTPC
jgi:hypothetical protein